MNRGTKIVVILVLALAASFFGWGFKTNYNRLMSDSADTSDTELINVKIPDYQKKISPLRTDYRLGYWGGGLVLSLLALGLISAHEVSQYFGQRTMEALYNDEGEGVANPDYEIAEEEWAKGNHLEAIRLMREYLEKNPREQHAALRIAEIYEKDLQNPLAAALEYEEILKQKLAPERWGWAAIHLCNLYTGKLDQLPKSVDLLYRIVAEYGETAAAEKARARLEQLAGEGIIPPLEEPQPEPEPEPEAPRPRLPPGFAPKKG
jgi:hypothetical protein